VTTIDVKDARPVEKPDGGEFPNLLAASTGTTVEVHVPEQAAAAQQLAAGRTITARVRRATPKRSFMDPARMTVR
jgi:hypothetical protein